MSTTGFVLVSCRYLKGMWIANQNCEALLSKTVTVHSVSTQSSLGLSTEQPFEKGKSSQEQKLSADLQTRYFWFTQQWKREIKKKQTTKHLKTLGAPSTIWWLDSPWNQSLTTEWGGQNISSCEQKHTAAARGPHTANSWMSTVPRELG